MNDSARGHFLRRLGGLLVCSLLALPVAAQERAYPSGPVTIVVPLGAGGATDVLARAIGMRLSDKWGKPVIIDNKPGGGGLVAARFVAKSHPDGSTLLLSLSTLVQGPHLYPERKMEDVLDELVPISLVGSNPVFWVVRNDFPAKTLGELVALVRSDPIKYGAFGSYGVGTTAHIVGLAFAKAAQISLNHVPYRGEAAEIQDLLGGQISMGIVSPSGARPQLEAGKFRALATTGTERSLLTPNVPTFREQGYRGMELSGWYGLLAPKGLSPQLATRISRDLTAVLADPVIQTQFRSFDIRLAGSTPAQFSSVIKRDYEEWGRLIRELGIKGE